MKKVNDYFNKILSLVLIICLITSMFSGCAPVSNLPETEIGTEAIAETITSEIQKLIAETEIQTEPISNAEKFSVDWFVYDRLFSDYSLVYDTFRAVLHLEDGSEISGFGYTDYSAYYETTDGKTGFFPAGFIADVGGVIPAEETENGLIIENLDYTDDKYQFVYAYDTDPFIEHCVVDGKYLQYGVNDSGAVYYSTEPYQRGHCEESLGALYSYDEEKFLFDPEMGTYVPITGASVFEAINYEDLEEEVNRILREQDINFSQQDVITSAHVAQEAVISYFLSLQEETFLGCNVQELVKCAEALDPMECIHITRDGHILVDVADGVPEGSEETAKWLVGISGTVVMVVLAVVGAGNPLLLPFIKAVIPEVIDVLKCVIMENQNIEDIQWPKVIASIATMVTMSYISPISTDQVIKTLVKVVDDENLQTICKQMLTAFSKHMASYITDRIYSQEEEGTAANDSHIDVSLLSGVIQAGSNVIENVLKELVPEILSQAVSIVQRVLPSEWITKLENKTDVYLNRTQLVKFDQIEDIIVPKVAHEITSFVMTETIQQLEKLGGGYDELVSEAYERHAMPGYDVIRLATGVQSKSQINLPAIKMSPQDHRLTASFGNLEVAVQYRERQKELIIHGDYQTAIQMDIDDIKSKFGTKYDKAITQMLEYAVKLGWWKKEVL